MLFSSCFCSFLSSFLLNYDLPLHPLDIELCVDAPLEPKGICSSALDCIFFLLSSFLVVVEGVPNAGTFDKGGSLMVDEL